MKQYNTITELLDAKTTDKDGKKHTFAEIGSSDNDYKEFKNRFEFFKEVLDRELHELSTEDIIKFHKYYHRLKDTLYNWYGFDTLLQVLEWENLKNK